ncbi:unnamed protein product [Brassica oleracea]
MQPQSLSFISSTSFPTTTTTFLRLLVRRADIVSNTCLTLYNFPTLSFTPNTCPSSSSIFSPETHIHEKLDSLGIDFLTLFNCHPPLHSSPLSSIKPVVVYMTTPPINFSLQDVCHLVSMFPNLLTSYLISHTIPVITLLLREVGFNSIFHLSPALRLRPRLLACSADTQLRHVFYFLLGIGILET